VFGKALPSWLAVFFLLWSPWARAQGDFYVVQVGDTLSSVAARFDASVAELARLNGLEGSLLRVGQTLRLPGVPSEGNRRHTVQAGETLAGIAARYGVGEAALRVVNPQLSEGGAAPGDVLRIPPPGGKLVRLNGGETLLDVALSHDVSVAEVVRINGLASLADARVGQLLYIPPATDATPPAALGGREQLASQQQQLLAKAAVLLTRYEPRPAGYRWPLEAHGRISSRFGVRNISVGGNTFHGGVDIAAPTGTPVLAAQDGVVVRAGWIGAYGYVVFVDHEGGAQTRYAHLSAMAVTPGARVAQGELLGWVGSTGASTGPHLHFELRFAGRAVDPLGYLISPEHQD
jgi:murein DD-endopeptidase MepM/ murein hydrolase activator NlpD